MRCAQAIIKNIFFEFERKLPRGGAAVTLLKAKIFEFCGRHSYEQCPAALRSQPPLRSAAHARVLADMDGSNWRQFLIEFEAILVPALEESGGAVPEATVLFSALRDIAVACSKSRADLKRHHILRTKLACFEFARSVCLRQRPALSRCCARRVGLGAAHRSAAAGRMPRARLLLHAAPDQPVLRLCDTPPPPSAPHTVQLTLGCARRDQRVPSVHNRHGYSKGAGGAVGMQHAVH